MANYAQTVNVIGAIKTSRTDAVFDATGLALALYRQRFGSVPVAVTSSVGRLDVSAALTKDGKALTVGVVNPTRDADRLLFNIRPAVSATKGTMWVLTGDDPMSANVPGKPPNVTVTERTFSVDAAGLPVPAYSVVIFRFELR
jgi:alpha-N-arabinofuranosidase